MVVLCFYKLLSPNGITTLTNRYKNENCISAKNFYINMATKTQHTQNPSLSRDHNSRNVKRTKLIELNVIELDQCLYTRDSWFNSSR